MTRRRPRDDRDDWQDGEPSTSGTGFGVGAIVLGIVALPLALVPCAGVVSLPLSGLGFLLGLGGVGCARNSGEGMGVSIAGAALSLFAFCWGVLWVFLMGAGVGLYHR